MSTGKVILTAMAFAAAMMFSFIMGIIVASPPRYDPSPSQFVLSCAEGGKVTEYVADQMDSHGDILQVWTKNGGTIQIKEPVCVFHIADHVR